MRVTELEARLMRYETKIEPRSMVEGDPATWHERGCPTVEVIGPRTYLTPVDNFADAQLIFLLCPVCFMNAKTNDKVGVHGLHVSFRERGCKENEGVLGPQGTRIYWTVSGTSLEDITTDPSILMLAGCHAHFYIRNGEIVLC